MTQTNTPGATEARGAPRRLLHILSVLTRHRILGALFGKTQRPAPKAVREAIEELGLTFIKFGQVLAIQRDLLPAAYTDELKLLHDKLPAMSFEMVRATIEAELGAPLDEMFSSFCETPIGAASIAQVHDATLSDGRRVAVKVQRPGLTTTITEDIAALNFLITLGEKLAPRLRSLDLRSALREFSTSLSRETNFFHEASSITIFRTTTTDFPDVWIPGVVAEYSRQTVLTMEFSVGERIDSYASRHAEAMPQIMNTLVRLMMQTIFEEGIFHADPHPGNVFILPDGRLSLLDFGSTGELDEKMREALTLLLEAVINGDARAATEAYLEMSPETENVNRLSLQNDIKAALYEIRRSNTTEVSLGNAFDALVRAGTRNGVRNPGEFVQLTRAVVILESMIRQLAPDHDYMQSFREQFSRLTAKYLSAERVTNKTGKFGRDLMRLMSEGPSDTRRILHRFAEGDLGRLPRLEALGERLDRNVERLAGAVVYGSLVIGGALLSLTPRSAMHHAGALMISCGVLGIAMAAIGAVRRAYQR